MKIIKSLLVFLLLLSAPAVIASDSLLAATQVISTQSAGTVDSTYQEIVDRMAENSPGGLAATFFDFLFPVGIVIGVLGIIRAGYTYLTSQGNPDQVREGSESLTASILGILFIILSLVILKVIINTLL